MSLRDAICAAAREEIYIISQPRFIEAISQPNAREVISHLSDKANISPKRIPYGICDMPVGTICHFVTRYALRRAGNLFHITAEIYRGNITTERK